MKYLLMILFILMVQNVYADCSDEQIDINSASLNELDEIIWVGNVTANLIIAGRPFESVNDLIKVKYITENRLNKIKEQGLACVDEIEEQENKESVEDEENIDEETSEELIESPEKDEPQKEILNFEIIDIKEKVKPKNIELEVIKLNPQTIKGESDNENLSRNNYPMYGLVFFCIVLGFLFMIRNNRFNKNEFR